MAYKCPQCRGDVSRGFSNSAQQAAGLVGLLFSGVFGAFTCNKCGKVPRSMFPAKTQAKMALGSFLLLLTAIGLAIGVFALMANME